MNEPAQRAKKAKPTILERAAQRVCPECSGIVVRRTKTGPVPTFCTPECKRARGNRRLTRGSAIVELAQAWRVDRGSGEIAKAAFAQMCAILDSFNAEDAVPVKSTGRPRGRADLMAAKIMADGTNYGDRKKR